MDEIKNSMIVDKDELRKKEIADTLMRAKEISHDSQKKNNAITDDYLKVVEASIDQT
jgi:hypothetical protein